MACKWAGPAGFKQMGIQLLGILFVVSLNVFVTSIIWLLIRIVVPLRLSDEELQAGDDAIHGEEAYALWGDGEKYESRHNSVYGVEEYFPQDVPKGVDLPGTKHDTDNVAGFCGVVVFLHFSFFSLMDS